MAILASQELIRAIRRFKAGDQETFEDIYNGSVQYITRCVLTVLNRTAPGADEDLMQDIIQDTYLTIATKLDTLKSEEVFLQWAGQIATNHALRTWEKNARQHDREQPEDEMLYELPDERFIPEDILYNKEKQRLIRQMLQELPTSQYLCLVEYFYNGLKEAEVAQKLGMPLGTVKTNLSRAKKKLKEIIQTHEKKSGVKLYSMSWLLLFLWKQLPVPEVSPQRLQAALDAVMQQLPKAAGISAGAAGATGGTTAAAAKMGMSLAAKIVAGVLAAAVTVGGIAAMLLPKDNTKPEAQAGPAPLLGDMCVPTSWHYNGHYYNLVGPFENWDQVLEYREEYGGYPMTINSQEESWIISELATGHHIEYEEDGEVTYTYIEDPTYTGLYWDRESSRWKWVNGEEVAYTNWYTEPEEILAGQPYWDEESGQWKVADEATVVYTNWLTAPETIPDSGHFGAYCPSSHDLSWRAGTLGAKEGYQYWVVWEYESDSTYEQRVGPNVGWIVPEGTPELILEYPRHAWAYENNLHGWGHPLPQTGKMPLVKGHLVYDGHHYVLAGTFSNWDEAVRFGDATGGYPASVTSEEENDAVFDYFIGYSVQMSIGLHRDGNTEDWKWHNGETVEYTNWGPELPEIQLSGVQAAYYYAFPNNKWLIGPTDNGTENGSCWMIFEYDSLPEFLEEGYQSAPEETQPADTDTSHTVVLTDEAKARMEQILLYVAYGDSGCIDTYVGQSWEEWLAHQEYEQFRFLELDTPAPTMWDKCEVLLMMGWNGDPALEGGPMPGFYGDPTGMSWSYLETVADRVITELLGEFDTSWLDGNVVAQGYTTDVSGGFVYQPITPLFSENYGDLTIEYIEDLGGGEVAIHAVYSRGFVLECVYYARENPASIIGYTLTGVTYSFAEE